MRGAHWAAMVAGAAVLSALVVTPARAAPDCDEYNPLSPALTGKITVQVDDSLGPASGELRTFVETGSIGKVDITNISASPKGIGPVSAVPEISRLSPRGGEQLKGIAIAVRVPNHNPRARVVLTLRQVCAQHFRDTFLYY